jgi:hypothetical protein
MFETSRYACYECLVCLKTKNRFLVQLLRKNDQLRIGLSVFCMVYLCVSFHVVDPIRFILKHFMYEVKCV